MRTSSTLAAALVLALLLPRTSRADPSATPLAPPSVDAAVQTGERAPRDAALVIGNEAYDELPQATYARADARAWGDWLLQSLGIRSSRVTVLQDAGKDELVRELRRSVRRVSRHGTLWVVFSGHGAMSAPEQGQRLLLARDARPEALDRGSIALSTALDEAKRRRIEHVVLVLDASFDGRGRDGLELVPGVHYAVPAALPEADRPGVLVWSAAPGDQAVDAWTVAHHGTFSWAALGALRGWADGELDGQPDGRVTLAEADQYAAWTRRQLGLVAAPGAVGSGVQGLVLARGEHLEAGPSDALLAELATERRRRRFDDAEALMQAEAAAFWQRTLDLARQGGPEGRQALEAFIAEFGDREITQTWTVALPQVREARHLLTRYQEQGEGQEAVQEVVAVAQEVAEVSCDDLVALEPSAMMGQLSAGQAACLERRIRVDRLQTDREKASRVLIANTQAAGDQGRWAALVERHLDEISRADPDLVMQYVVFLFKTNPLERGEDAIHWADVALENKQRWEGDTYVKNVGALLRIRTETAYKLWTNADKEYRASPDDDSEWQAEEYRGITKDFAREWLDYLRAAGQPADLALQICTSAAGTADFCRAR